MTKREKGVRRRCTSASAQRSPQPTKKRCRRDRRSPISAVSPRWTAKPRAASRSTYTGRSKDLPGRLGFKLYRSGAPIALSDSLPMLERMGVRVLSERGYQLTPEGGGPLWVHDFSLQLSGADDIDAEAIAPLFEESFARVFEGAVENDDFNRLVLRAGLSADEIVVLRAYAKVMRQTGFALSQTFIETTLATHPRIARMLVGLFKLRFDPGAVRSRRGCEPGQRDRASARQSVESFRRQSASPVPGADRRNVANQLLAHRRRRERCGGAAARILVVQV